MSRQRSVASRLARLLAVPLTVAWLLGALAVGTALGHVINGTWHTNCYASEVCIWSDINFGAGGARAAMSGGPDHGSMTLYQGQYPGTGTNLNDSVTSLQNTYNLNDATFYHGSDYSGSNACYDSFTAWSWVSFNHNDNYSSHRVHPGDGYC